MTRFACSLVLALLAAACGGKSAPATSSTGGSESSGGGAPVVTLKDLQNGDRACYVVVESAAGEQSIEGDFELCPGGSRDATALIGQPVVYTTEPGKVLAAACEGDVDCGQSDDVDLVITIAPAP